MTAFVISNRSLRGDGAREVERKNAFGTYPPRRANRPRRRRNALRPVSCDD
jgi:hypothetical protein